MTPTTHAGSAAPLALGVHGPLAEPVGAPTTVGAELLAAVERVDLRGRGGAAFPLATKLRAVAGRPGPRVVVANGEEGEPASMKDRWLVRHRPHLVLDGLLRAAEIVDADRAVLYVSDREAARAGTDALADLDATVPVTVHLVEATYVAGEETAVVRALDGGPALPVDKPPRPFEAGVGGRPTLVSNVETLARLALLARGQHAAADSLLLTVSGACERPGLYDVPFGTPLAEVLATTARPHDDAVGHLLGGFFGGVLDPASVRDLVVDPDHLRDRGTGLGSGAVVVLGRDDCPVAAAADVLAYLARENADQCGACIRGTPAMAGALADLAAGTGTAEQLESLQRWSTSLRGRGACGLLDAATVVVASLLQHFPDDARGHLGAVCPRCAAHPVDPTTTRFAVDGALIPSPTTPGGSS